MGNLVNLSITYGLLVSIVSQSIDLDKKTFFSANLNVPYSHSGDYQNKYHIIHYTELKGL